MTTYTSHVANYTPKGRTFDRAVLVTVTVALVSVMIGRPHAASAAPIPITGCPAVISAPGSYRLDVDCKVGADQTAISVHASNVQLNLNDRVLSGPVLNADGCVESSTGVDIDGTNVHVSNGVLIHFRRAILFFYGQGHQSNNLTVTGNCYGILVFHSNNNQVNANNVSGNFGGGVILTSANDNKISNNVENNNGPMGGTAGVFLDNSNGNLVNSNDVIVNLNARGIRLIASNNNVIRNNRLIGQSEEGIVIDAAPVGSYGNLIQANRAVFNGNDFTDANPGCLNTWKNNEFVTDSETGADAGPGAGCIR